MKKLLLLSALILTTNIAGAATVDPCDDIAGNWFGTKIVYASSNPAPDPTFITDTSRYNYQNKKFYLQEAGSEKTPLFGTCSNGKLSFTKTSQESFFHTQCYKPIGTEYPSGLYTGTVITSIQDSLISNGKIEISCVLDLQCLPSSCSKSPSYSAFYTYRNSPGRGARQLRHVVDLFWISFFSATTLKVTPQVGGLGSSGILDSVKEVAPLFTLRG